MGVDPVAGALSTIEPGALSERQQRIATGIALIRDGMSLLQASKTVGIPLSTMWRYSHGISKVESETADGMTLDTGALHEASVDVALIAVEKMRDALVNDPDVKLADVIKAYSASADRAIALGGRAVGPAVQGQTLLSKLLEGSRVTIEPARDDHRAMDVDVEVIG